METLKVLGTILGYACLYLLYALWGLGMFAMLYAVCAVLFNFE